MTYTLQCQGCVGMAVAQGQGRGICVKALHVPAGACELCVR